MFKKIKIDKHTFSLFFLVISTFLLSQSYSAAISFAQTESGSTSGVTQSPTESILVCEFVQYCSNPVELSKNDNDTAGTTPVTPETEAQTTAETEAQTTAETEAQTTPDSSELLPDVTSNISLIMTPDLPGNLAEKDSQDPVNQNLLAANQTQQISSNATEDSQLVVPENATVITPAAQIPLETTGENISMTIQDDNDATTANISSSNQSEFTDTVPLNNVTMSIDDSNMSQNAPVEETMDTTAANETMDTTAANETMDTTAANETMDTTAANETMDTTAANETMDTTAANETMDTTAANETMDTTAANETMDTTAANETMDTTAANETMDTTAANETMDTTAANETMDTTAANETSEIEMPIVNENQSTTSNIPINPTTTNVNQQDNASNVNEVQPNISPTSENQTAPPFFLDPLINPFKELFGIK